MLIADDDESVRAVIAFYFDSLHCETCLRADTDSTIEALQREPFDLLVLDLYLGDEPGMEVLRWMNEHRPSTPSVLMSGSDDVFAIEQARRLGILEFWPKPTRFQAAHRLAQRLWPKGREGLSRVKKPLGRDSELVEVVEQFPPNTQHYKRRYHHQGAQSK